MPDANSHTLVTDFDGTLTKYDFYELVSRQLLPPDTPDYWSAYRAGTITHFEALRGYFAAIRTDEASVWQVVDRMEIDPQLADAVARLRAASWHVVIASAGCSWYINRLLGQAGVCIETHANPGHFEPGQGLLMELSRQSPFFSPTHGINKAAIVRHFLATAVEIAFAGDGYPDLEAALLVPPERRFARGALAQELTRIGQSYRSFEVWSDIARALMAPSR